MSDRKTYTSKDKWIVSLIFALLFFLISYPPLYKFTSKYVSNYRILDSNGCPSIIGVSIHAIIFFFAVRLII
jgi:hypothetical protein